MQRSTLVDLSEQLHQTPRTLRRRLQEQGTTFRQLLDDVRAELELHLEMQGEPLTEISELMGYSDPTVYLHAQGRWRGAR